MAEHVEESLQETFASFQTYIEDEQKVREEIREKVRQLEELARQMLAKMQVIHSGKTNEGIKKICSISKECFDQVKEKYHSISQSFPSEQYFRYSDHWKFVTQRLVFLASLTVYLDSEILITRETAAEMLGVKAHWKDGFHLDLDDFLIGILQLASELSRLAVNCVRFGDYDRPGRIASFLSNLDMAFRLLNMKNDALRRRYDALKYDLKKTEEIVYDLSIRGLSAKPKPDN